LGLKSIGKIKYGKKNKLENIFSLIKIICEKKNS